MKYVESRHEEETIRHMKLEQAEKELEKRWNEVTKQENELVQKHMQEDGINL